MFLKRKIHNYLMYLGLLSVAVVYCLLLFITFSHEKIYAAGGMELSLFTRYTTTPTLQFSLLATHPEAAVQPTSLGKTIADLAVLDDKLYAGYGDYSANTGPIKINPLNLKTNTFTGSELTILSEAILQFRQINGKLYAPMTDPDRPALEDAGYGLLSDGSWSSVYKAPAIHLYDMATLNGTDLWMVGSAMEADGKTGKGAIAYRSLEGGETWTIAMEGDISSPQSGFERYYWVAELDGKIYMQAESVTPATPVRIFDGADWTTGTTERICTYRGGPEVFAGYIICPGRTELSLFDGTSVQAVALPHGKSCQPGSVTDVHVSDDKQLYALSSSGCIFRSNDAKKWELLGSGPANARSIAVQGNKVYLGTTEAQIFVAEK